MADKTAKIKYLENEDGVIWLPVTHEKAVLDDEGTTLDTKLAGKQTKLVSGTNIKTINGESILGSGNIEVQTEITMDNVPTSGSDNPVKSGGIYTSLQGKQDTLVSGSTIKTLNNTSLLGSGNITIENGVGFDSISTPSTPDGSMEIALTNGDTITIDLNHNHPQYLKYVYLEDESEMPATPDATTLYLILDNSNA